MRIIITEFIYPAHFEAASEGGYVVTFSDIPEAITQGETLKNAYIQATDCLEETIAAYITSNKPIPNPSKVTKDLHAIPCSAQIVAKAALYIAIRAAGISKVQLAGRLTPSMLLLFKVKLFS